MPRFIAVENGVLMSDYADLKQCALYALSAFPVQEPDTEMPGKVIAGNFHERGLPAERCTAGVRHCVSMGWMKLLPQGRVRLLEPGVDVLKGHMNHSGRRHVKGGYSLDVY